jgi:hypothetical protein
MIHKEKPQEGGNPVKSTWWREMVQLGRVTPAYVATQLLAW